MAVAVAAVALTFRRFLFDSGNDGHISDERAGGGWVWPATNGHAKSALKPQSQSKMYENNLPPKIRPRFQYARSARFRRFGSPFVPLPRHCHESSTTNRTPLHQNKQTTTNNKSPSATTHYTTHPQHNNRNSRQETNATSTTITNNHMDTTIQNTTTTTTTTNQQPHTNTHQPHNNLYLTTTTTTTTTKNIATHQHNISQHDTTQQNTTRHDTTRHLN